VNSVTSATVRLRPPPSDWLGCSWVADWPQASQEIGSDLLRYEPWHWEYNPPGELSGRAGK
jgi:hypothetical protein